MGVKPIRLSRFLLAGILVAGPTAAAEHQLASADSSGGQARERPSQVWDVLDPAGPHLRSAHALVLDGSGREVYAKAADEPVPIASITKLMTAMVILDSGLDLEEPVTVTREDRDLLKLTGSRLKYGATLPREKMLRLALMASENRAASALARTYPGGKQAFVEAMNRKAEALGMDESRFADPTGLDPGNRASARDLARMVQAAFEYPLIRESTTTESAIVHPYSDRGPLRYVNTNRLLRNGRWRIELSKTGYIDEAGRCLVMRADIADRPMVIVFLDSFGTLTPYGDSNRLRKWIEGSLAGRS